MEKIFLKFILLTLVLILLLPIVTIGVFASENSSLPLAESGYNNEDTDTLVNVDITYTSFSFTYNAGLWNPNELRYEEGEWSAGDDGGQITVTNQGLVDVNVSFTFEAENLSGLVENDYLDGVFSGADLTDNTVALPVQAQTCVTFTVTGVPLSSLDDVTAGKIIITITAALNAEGGQEWKK